jgi:hypothetical protein
VSVASSQTIEAPRSSGPAVPIHNQKWNVAYASGPHPRIRGGERRVQVAVPMIQTASLTERAGTVHLATAPRRLAGEESTSQTHANAKTDKLCDDVRVRRRDAVKPAQSSQITQSVSLVPRP